MASYQCRRERGQTQWDRSGTRHHATKGGQEVDAHLDIETQGKSLDKVGSFLDSSLIGRVFRGL